MKTVQRIFKYDFLRTVAIVIVVANHILTKFDSTPFENSISDYLNTFLKFAVPLFLFISGALYRIDGNWKYLFRKLWKIVSIYLIYFIPSTIYLWWKESAFETSFKFDFSGLLLGREFGHYFIFVFVSIVIVGFILLRFKTFQKNTLYLFLSTLILSLIWLSVDELIYHTYGWYDKNIFHFRLNDLVFYRNPFTWTAFFTFGIWYQKKEVQEGIESKKNLLFGLLLGIFFIYNFMYFNHLGDYTPYGSIIWLLYAMLLIPFFIRLSKFVKERSFIVSISLVSFHIFLTHYFIIYFLQEINDRTVSGLPYYLAPLLFLIVLFTSTVLSLGIFKTGQYKS